MEYIPARGRPGLLLNFNVERELVPQDLLTLATAPPQRQSLTILQKVTARHRTAARLVADGMSNIEVAQVTGYTPQRISDLKIDPMFCELVTYFGGQRTDQEISDGARLRGKVLENAEEAADEITARLEDPAKRAAIPVAVLLAIQSDGLDRTVAPRKNASPTIQTPTQITFNMGTRDIRPQESDPKPITIEHEEKSNA